jgi:hypothetical protein
MDGYPRKRRRRFLFRIFPNRLVDLIVAARISHIGFLSHPPTETVCLKRCVQEKLEAREMFYRAPRWAPNVPDRTLGGVYLLSAMVMQWCVVMILLKSLIALGVVFIGL